MAYPCLKKIEDAGWYDLLNWWLYLPAPGSDARGLPAERFENLREKEAKLWKKICERWFDIRENDQINRQV